MLSLVISLMLDMDVIDMEKKESMMEVLLMSLYCLKPSQAVLVVNNLPANAADTRCWFDPWVGKIPWRRAWQRTPALLPGESPWTEEPGGLQSMGSQRVEHNSSDLAQHSQG